MTREPDPTTRLVVKLTKWLMVQPEWVQIFAQGRAQRRRLAQAIAKTVTTIPPPEGGTE